MGGSSSVVSFLVAKSHKLFNGSEYSNIRLINFEDFKQLNNFPRFPENESIAILASDVESKQYESTFIVFVSHCWLRGWPGAEGWDGRPHPDNSQASKFQLCIQGIEKLKKEVAPEMTDCYIWLDFGCIDQNGNPAGELKMLDKIVQICDCIFTPIYDKPEENWESPQTITNRYEDYKSKAWNGTPHSYLNRAWCRIEMFYAANIPLLETHRKLRMKKMTGGLRRHHQAGRRPHFVYGTHESTERRFPVLMPPLQNSWFTKYHPEQGQLTQETDREKIKSLVADLQPYMNTVQVGYKGSRNKEGKKEGKGKMIFSNGDVYQGYWENDQIEGKGIYIYANGNSYDGEWKANKQHGYGEFIDAQDNRYVCQWVKGIREGHGKHIAKDNYEYEGDFHANKRHGNGVIHFFKMKQRYEGEWKDDRKHGQGKYFFASGDVYEGEWKEDQRDGTGECIYANQSTYRGRWKDNVFDGVGVFTNAETGEVYEGQFVAGKRQGKGKLTNHKDGGSIYEGEFHDNMKHGKGIYRFPDGKSSYVGDWHEGVIEGAGKMYYTNGDVYDGEWKRFLRHGYGVYQFANQDKYEGEWREDKENGRGKFIFASTGLVQEGKWSDGAFQS